MAAHGGDELDEGMASERTALAWQRTALSLMASAAILGRLTFSELGWAAVALLAVAALLGLWVFVESGSRYLQHHGLRRRARPRGGRAALCLASATCLIALTEVVALLG